MRLLYPLPMAALFAPYDTAALFLRDDLRLHKLFQP